MPSKGLQSLLKEYADSLTYGDTAVNPHYFPTGLIGLDYIVADNGGKGFPGRSIIQLIGNPKNGKTTLAYSMLAQAQRSGIRDIKIGDRVINSVLLDIERSYDEIYARKIGVDVEKLLVIRTHYVEQSFSLSEHLLLEGVQFTILDSVASFITKSEEDKDYDDNEKMAAEATAIRRYLKRVNAFIEDNAIVVLINQYRKNISPMARTDRKAYGTEIIQQLIKASIRLTRIKNEDDRAEVEALVEKTKFGPESRKTTFHIDFGEAIDYDGHVLDLALQFGIVEKRAAWYYYGELKANGTDNAKQAFPMEEIEKKVKEYMEKGS